MGCRPISLQHWYWAFCIATPSIHVFPQETNPNFASFMAQLTQNEHVDVLGLQSYLIKPLQRITKVSCPGTPSGVSYTSHWFRQIAPLIFYSKTAITHSSSIQYGLLMRELKKCTPVDHPSYTNVCTANDLVGHALEVKLCLSFDGLTLLRGHVRPNTPARVPHGPGHLQWTNAVLTPSTAHQRVYADVRIPETAAGDQGSWLKCVMEVYLLQPLSPAAISALAGQPRGICGKFRWDACDT